ncbi:hypothetical protein GCM10010358_70450 [Streptomyces minutiscleroticus]|uniref:Uncharacterized protein n=2 Tax=Streptomyces minutiscleroticus TaxID=68238 RepID=A0A918NYP8_9ACTN|nr:hypothetical protein GCM10010358_70450 [Streptomyces minutiscleroticus]
MHRQLNSVVRVVDLFPLAVLSDCATCCSPEVSPLIFRLHAVLGEPQTRRIHLKPAADSVKPEGFQPVLWVVDMWSKT